MSANDAIAILNLLERAHVRSWLEGGWGVDALVGRQTRDHRDIDLFIELRQVDSVRALLAGEGFVELEGGRPANFVLSNQRLETDIHVFQLDAAGNGHYQMADGTTWVCPAAGLAGRGTIAGREVVCFTPELQLQCYSGYEFDQNDLHDIALLRETFPNAVALPLDVRPVDWLP